MSEIPHYYQVTGAGDSACICELMDIIDLWCSRLDKSEYQKTVEAFYVGNVLKYLWRYPHKGDKAGDIKKALHYLNLLLNEVTLN